MKGALVKKDNAVKDLGAGSFKNKLVTDLDVRVGDASRLVLYCQEHLSASIDQGQFEHSAGTLPAITVVPGLLLGLYGHYPATLHDRLLGVGVLEVGDGSYGDDKGLAVDILEHLSPVWRIIGANY